MQWTALQRFVSWWMNLGRSLRKRVEKMKNPLSYLRQKQEPEQPTLEQIRQVIEQAEKFDKLQAMPGWEDILKFLAAEVNGTLTEAAGMKRKPILQKTFVVRWDAKRELLDNMLGWIDQQQAERDRIVEEARRGKEDFERR